jgi:hypothetical protein
MTGEKKMFSSYEKNDDPQKAITFGDGNQGMVKGLGKIAISPDHSISNVFLVDALDYNLLSVSQLCHMGYNCLFTNIGVTVFRRSDDSVAFKGVLKGQRYLVDFTNENTELDTCLIAKTNMGWLWHRRLAHVGTKNLHKLLKGKHILGLTNVHFEKDRTCSACQAGKQVGAHHPHKNIMTTERPLELLHMDLCWGEGKGATLRSKSSLSAAEPTATKQAGTPFAPSVPGEDRRRRASHGAASSSSEAHVQSGPS